MDNIRLFKMSEQFFPKICDRKAVLLYLNLTEESVMICWKEYISSQNDHEEMGWYLISSNTAGLHMGTDTGASSCCPSTAGFGYSSTHMPTMDHYAFSQTGTAHSKIQCKNSKQFSLRTPTNKFSLCIRADMQSFATFKVIIQTSPSRNHINNNSLLML